MSMMHDWLSAFLDVHAVSTNNVFENPCLVNAIKPVPVPIPTRGGIRGIRGIKPQNQICQVFKT
jgi:hypothetical protein